jgi:hypothetical protein
MGDAGGWVMAVGVVRPLKQWGTFGWEVVQNRATKVHLWTIMH